MIPLTFSIAEGIAFGLVAASLLELARRGVRRSALPLHALAVLIVAGYFAM
jgi:xanthine/uracil/vitamin C permease (AzgA family)